MTPDQHVTRGREVAEQVESRARDIEAEVLDIGGNAGAVHYLARRLAWLERDLSREERHVARLEALFLSSTGRQQ